MSKSLPELFYENDCLYLFSSDEGVILFRPLTYREFKIAKKISQFYPEHRIDLEDWVWDHCVIEHTLGHSLDHIKAGTVISLFNCIYSLSSPNSIEEANAQMGVNRSELSDVLNQAAVIVCQAFPNYTTRQVEDMYWIDIVKKLAESEVILAKPLDFKKAAPIDDSHKVFNMLDKMSEDNLDHIMKERPVDFRRENSKLEQV